MAPSLRCIVNFGDDISNIDKDYCSQRGIFVAVCNGQNSHAVAELTLGLIISVNRRMIDANNYLKQGYWVKEAFTSCKGLKEQTLGLIGFGKIAQLVCKMAIALEIKVLVHTRT